MQKPLLASLSIDDMPRESPENAVIVAHAPVAFNAKGVARLCQAHVTYAGQIGS